MFDFDWNLIRKLALGDRPPDGNVAVGQYDELPHEGLTMGTLVIGRPGTGKTSYLAKHIVDYFKTYPDRAIFVLDWSGSISDYILSLVLADPMSEKLVKRLVYDELGNPEIVIPMPEFSEAYGGSFEEQAQRVSQNMVKLSPALAQNAPVLGWLALTETGSNLFRLLTAITNEHDEPWQITEAKKLLVDVSQMNTATKKFGRKVPEAKFYFENEYMSAAVKPSERDLRTYALRAILGAVEPRPTRARVGYYKPGWTPREAIQKGLLVLVNGARMINEKSTQHYLFTQAYSLIMSEINKRTPGDPKDKPVALVMDEVYSLLSIPGMAEEVGMLSPLYRSRKLELYIVLQSLAQLAKPLDEQIWSIGNLVSFAVSNFDEAYKISQQVFKYQPTLSKLPAKTDNQQPMIEPDRGQYLTHANWIQRLNHRQCLIRRYYSERTLDKYLRLIPKTRDHQLTRPGNELQDLKDALLKERGVAVREALEIINHRKMKPAGRPQA